MFFFYFAVYKSETNSQNCDKRREVLIFLYWILNDSGEKKTPLVYGYYSIYNKSYSFDSVINDVLESITCNENLLLYDQLPYNHSKIIFKILGIISIIIFVVEFILVVIFCIFKKYVRDYNFIYGITILLGFY